MVWWSGDGALVAVWRLSGSVGVVVAGEFGFLGDFGVDVPFSCGDGRGLQAACKAMVSVLDGQRGQRLRLRTIAMERFEGPFAETMELNGTRRITSVNSLEAGLQAMWRAVDKLAEAARHEQTRREHARQWAWQQATPPPLPGTGGLGTNGLGGGLSSGVLSSGGRLGGGWPPPPGPDLPGTFRVTAHVVGLLEFGTCGGVGDRVGAAPDDLRVFVAGSRDADQVLRGPVNRVRAAYEAFTNSCRWGRLVADDVVHGLGRYIDRCTREATAVAVIADAFETAGGYGTFETVLHTMVHAPVPGGARVFIALTKSAMLTSDITAAWNALDAATRAWLITHRPFLIGNTDGIPFTIRDQANRAELARLEAWIERSRPMAQKLVDQAVALAAARGRILTDAEQADLLARKLEEVSGLNTERITAIAVIKRQLRLRPEVRLVSFDTRHEGNARAAFAFGDLDSAKDTCVYVPGVGSRISKETLLKGYLNNIDALRKQTKSVIRDAHTGEQASVAAVLWMGYSAPGPNQTAAFKNRSTDGGTGLAGFGDGIKATNPAGKVTLFGHSYGSEVASNAASKTDSFDRLVVAGSPGITSGEVDDYRRTMPTYAGRAEGDVITAVPEIVQTTGLVARGAGGLGPVGIPLAIAGAGVTVVASGDDPAAGHGPTPAEQGFTTLPTWQIGHHTASHGHSQYLRDGTSFQQSLAAITAGHPEKIPQ